jgi:zinc D-Ala-D-Ala carboxypeptidase
MTDMIEAAHWRAVDPGAWPWPNFSPAEMASKGDGSLRLSRDAMDRLQRLRARLGVPMQILSAYRDPAHNKRVGGAKRSQHLRGRAFDVRVDNIDPAALIAATVTVTATAIEGFIGFGTYPRQGFVHIDTRETPASWGPPFATRFAPEAVAKAIIADAAPVLPPEWVSIALAGIAVISFGVVLWRAFGRGREQ